MHTRVNTLNVLELSRSHELVYLCDNIFLQIQEDICIFQGEDTLLHFYIWDHSWLQNYPPQFF